MIAISYVTVSLLLGIFLNESPNEWISYWIITLFVGAVVIIEPKTYPFNSKEQVIYGVVIAFFIASLDFIGTPNAIAIGLLIGDFVCFIYKR